MLIESLTLSELFDLIKGVKHGFLQELGKSLHLFTLVEHLDDSTAQLGHVFVLFFPHGYLHEGYQNGWVHVEDFLPCHV